MPNNGVQVVPQKTMQQVRREARREELVKPALELLATHRIALKGHFDLGHGQHSDQYMNPHAILDTPPLVWQLAQCLIDLSVDASEADTVAGPMMGGAFLAYVIAGILSGQSRPGAPVTRFVPLQEVNNEFTIRTHYLQFVHGKRIWLVDDVCRTGQTLSLCAATIEEAGGRVVATGVILQNEKGILIRDPALKAIHHAFVDTFSAGSVDSDKCPQCQAGVPLTQF